VNTFTCHDSYMFKFIAAKRYLTGIRDNESTKANAKTHCHACYAYKAYIDYPSIPINTIMATSNHSSM